VTQGSFLAHCIYLGAVSDPILAGAGLSRVLLSDGHSVTYDFSQRQVEVRKNQGQGERETRERNSTDKTPMPHQLARTDVKLLLNAHFGA
jgi:hypothetical protein